jgi:aldehyde:ferredoxin oxidoreductase
MGGFLGDLVYLDLSTGESRRETLKDRMVPRLLGGRGVNAQILWDLTEAKQNPMSPESPLIFGAGALNATAAPSGGRLTLTFKSPATAGYFKSSVGGHFGAALRKAGISCLVVTGKAAKPVFVFIDDGQVKLERANSLWGEDVRTTTREVKRRLKDDQIQVACIGQAGENKVTFAAVMFSTYNAAARGGGGAVMGSKNLKAVAVRGTGRVEIQNPSAFSKACLKYRKLLARDTAAQALYNLGTAGLVELNNEARVLPCYNFKQVTIPNASMIAGYHLEEAGYLKGRIGCSGCTISCHRFTRVDRGPYSNCYSAGPEFETASALGSGCGITDTEVLLKANELCNLYGLDTISTGTVIQWAMECFEKGILDEKDLGGSLEWGDGKRALELIHNIANRRNFGDVLAKGLRRASEEVGKDSGDFAVQARGLEQSRVEVRVKKGNALAFAVNPRGPDHLHSQVTAENARTPEAVALIERITGDSKYAKPYLVEKRAEIVRWHEDCYAVTDSLGFCSFATTMAYAISPSIMARLLELASGVSLEEQELMQAGQRIVVIEHCFNVREGLTRRNHVLPKRMMSEPVPEGPWKGLFTSEEELNRMLDEYYTLHGWETKSARPTKLSLRRLGLNKVASELDEMGLLG